MRPFVMKFTNVVLEEDKAVSRTSIISWLQWILCYESLSLTRAQAFSGFVSLRGGQGLITHNATME